MKTLKTLVIAILLVCLLCSCAKVPQEPQPTVQHEYAKAGLFGMHSLDIIEKNRDLSGTFTGRFFIGGMIDGEISAATTISFRWSSLEGQYQISEVPLSKFVTIIDEAKTSPEIEFVFADYWLKSCYNAYEYAEACKTALADPSRVNLNDVIQSTNLTQVRVYISSAARANESSLP